MGKSKLNRKLLAKIWVLCDQHKQGKLDKLAFAAMFHLVFKVKKSAGALSVPAQLPRCLTIDFLEKLGTHVEHKTMEKKWVTQTRTVQVRNPNKGGSSSKKRKKKKKTPPPLPAENATTNASVNADAFGGNDDWGNGFSFDDQVKQEPVAAAVAVAAPTETPGGDNNGG